MRIIGPPSGAWETVRLSLTAMGATTLFIDQIAPAVWRAATGLIVDPVGAVAQSYKETGAGKFGGNVKPAFYNTCGLKVRDVALVKSLTGNTYDDQPLAHQMFPNWETGALAQVQHLRAYAGWPVEGLIVDPRYTFVKSHFLTNFEDLGGKWAPSLTYGNEIVAVANKLLGR